MHFCKNACLCVGGDGVEPNLQGVEDQPGQRTIDGRVWTDGQQCVLLRQCHRCLLNSSPCLLCTRWFRDGILWGQTLWHNRGYHFSGIYRVRTRKCQGIRQKSVKGRWMCVVREIWLWQLNKMLVTKLWCEPCMNCNVHGHVLRLSTNLPVVYSYCNSCFIRDVDGKFGLTKCAFLFIAGSFV